MFFGCSSGDQKEEKKPEIRLKKTTSGLKKANAEPKTFTYLTPDLDNKGIGPINSIEIKRRIDKSQAEEGKEVFKRMCSACHRPDKKFIGPEMKDILKRRTPEWVMNTMLDPEGMLIKDSLTMKIFGEFNNIIMPNQDPTEEEARAMLEYFRTLK